MTRSIIHRLQLIALASLAGCVSPTTAPAPQPVRPAAQPAYSRVGLESVIGQNARALQAAFGRADADVHEGPARKLQFAGPACVLDAYLYAPARGGEPVVTHIDARLPDGRDFDRASCVAALSRRGQAR